MKTLKDRGPETVPLRLVVTNADRSLSARREEWISHYSRKRIVHQWTQLALLVRAYPVVAILIEIGPFRCPKLLTLRNLRSNRDDSYRMI